MQDTNGEARDPPHGECPEGNDRPERRRTYPDEAPQEWEDDYVDLGGEG